MIYYALLVALALQRLQELKIGNANLERIQSRLLNEPDPGEKRQMMILHSAWFLACGIEFGLLGRLQSEPAFLAGILLLAVCQFVRYQSMQALGESWVHLPVAYRGQQIVNHGMYRYLRHPNYLVVGVEIALVPFLGSAYGTMAVFSLLNFIFLRRRIRLEESQLKKVRNL